MGLQRNIFGEKMDAIPHSGEAGRENPVPMSDENVGHTTPAPATVPRAMHQDERARHSARGSGIAHPGHFSNLLTTYRESTFMARPRP